MLPRHFLASVRDRLVASRFFTISLTLHLILIAVFGTKVLIDQATPPPDVTATILPDALPAAPPRPSDNLAGPRIDQSIFTPPSQGDPSISVITSLGEKSPSLPTFTLPLAVGPATEAAQVKVDVSNSVASSDPGRLSAGERKEIYDFTQWREPSRGSQAFSFTAFLGRYQGGNWNSTVRVQNGEITGGSLPNLLYAMSKWSKDRIKTNERQVRAIALDSPELLTARPPFVLLTGTRDFKLTEGEVENLRLYIRSGGAVWGDSSVPGQRSAFDLAFQREMRRVLPDGNQDFQALPENHPVFTAGFYKQVKSVPGGINHYSEGVRVLRWRGEIAVIQTLNDYGDMWQIGLDKDGEIDTSRNARGEYVAMNATLWQNREIYVRNVEKAAVEQAYRFGINMVLHLLTRWEDRLSSPGAL